jgi:hypothetical protein
MPQKKGKRQRNSKVPMQKSGAIERSIALSLENSILFVVRELLEIIHPAVQLVNSEPPGTD